MKTWYCVTSQIDNAGRMSGRITATTEAAEKPPCTEKHLSHKSIYLDWFGSREAAEAWLDEIKNA